MSPRYAARARRRGVGQAGERDLGVATEQGHRHQSPKAQGRLGRHLVDQIVGAGGCHTTLPGSASAGLDEDLEGVDASARANARTSLDRSGNGPHRPRATAATLLLWSCPDEVDARCASPSPLGRPGAQFLLLVLPDVGDPNSRRIMMSLTGNRLVRRSTRPDRPAHRPACLVDRWSTRAKVVAQFLRARHHGAFRTMKPPNLPVTPSRRCENRRRSSRAQPATHEMSTWRSCNWATTPPATSMAGSPSAHGLDSGVTEAASSRSSSGTS